MRSTRFFFPVLLAVILATSPLFAQAKNVRFSVSSISIAEIPFKIAQVKGFYREEGLNVDDPPVCVPDGTPPPPSDHALYTPTTRPGARAPHVRLRDGRSTLDLFGRGFVLLNLSSKERGAAALSAAAERAGVPLTVVALSEPEAREAYERDLVLVRPDGHVAWRGDSVPSDGAKIIATVRGAN